MISLNYSSSFYLIFFVFAHFYFFYYFSLIVKDVHVLWLDNYSKNYKQNMYTVRNETGYKDCQWSAEGVSPYTKQPKESENGLPQISLKLPKGDVLCGCPSLEEFDHWFEEVRSKFFFWVDGPSTSNIFNDVEVTILKISSIPISFTKSLKQLKNELGNDDEAKTAFKDQFEKVTLMDSFYPLRLLKLNIGSNVGVVRWLSRLQHRMLHGEYKDKYVVLKVDCNIYLHVLDVSLYEFSVLRLIFLSFVFFDVCFTGNLFCRWSS